MIITIDKTKELTRKEYIDFLMKTKGETIGESRLSQLVSAGKLKVRDYPDLNNLQLIVLDDEEQALAQARFSTSQALHTFSYKDLGLMFGKLILDLTTESGNAKTLLAEKQAQLDQLVATIGSTEQQRDKAQQTVITLTEKVAELTAVLTELQQLLNTREAQLGAQEADLKTLRELLAETERKLTAETSFRKEFEEFKTMVLFALKPQPSPTPSGKSRQKQSSPPPATGEEG